MALSVEVILTAIAPEFSSLDNSVIISIADTLIAPDFCGDNRNTLVAYRAAHMIDIAQRYAGSSGGISSVTEGGASISYGNSRGVSGGSSGLSDTTYGRQYLELLKSCDIPLRTRVCDVIIDY